MADKNHDYAQLDSLRGIACLQVLNQHILMLWPVMFMPVAWFMHSDKLYERVAYYINFTPLHLWFMAYEAVIFFFVLSGFVLHSSLKNGVNARGYAQYLVKRFFRLYIPFAAAILLSMMCRALFYHHADFKDLSDWFRQMMWSHPVSAAEFFNLITFWSHDFGNVDTTLWSIELEIKISILIPLFIAVINLFRRNKVADVVFNVLVLLAALFLFHNADTYFSHDDSVFYDAFVVKFTFAFVAGIMLSKYLDFFRRLVYNLSVPAVIAASTDCNVVLLHTLAVVAAASMVDICHTTQLRKRSGHICKLRVHPALVQQTYCTACFKTGICFILETCRSAYTSYTP